MVWSRWYAAAASTGAALLLAATLGVTAPVATAAQSRITVQNCGDGVTSVRYLPDPTFDPLTASRSALVAHGYPARPSDPAEAAAWHTFVARGSVPWAPCGRPHAGSSAITYSPSPNWAGRVDTGHAYKQVFATWKVPTAKMAGSSTYGQSVAWVGLGSGTPSAPLFQGGTSSYVEGPGSLDYNTWWEVFPRNSVQHFPGPVHPGDTVYAHMEITGPKSATLEVIDETSNSGGTKHYTGSTSTSRQAEWIFERPGKTGRLHGLSAGGVHFTSAGAAISTKSSADKAAGAFAGHYVRMHNCADTKTLATPAALSDHGFDEIITRNHDGAGDDCAAPSAG